MLHLTKPAPEHEKLWYAIIKEFEDAGEKIIPYSLKSDCDTYADFLEVTKRFEEGKDIPDNLVPCTVYFLFDEGEDKILGCAVIRHRLNDALRFSGGNIGYGIAPSERGKGYAVLQLALVLTKCREMKLDRVLLTCDKHNVRSSKAMLANGAAFDSEFTDCNGTVRERYWITLCD